MRVAFGDAVAVLNRACNLFGGCSRDLLDERRLVGLKLFAKRGVDTFNRGNVARGVFLRVAAGSGSDRGGEKEE